MEFLYSNVEELTIKWVIVLYSIKERIKCYLITGNY